jgi:hypothetical protein
MLNISAVEGATFSNCRSFIDDFLLYYSAHFKFLSNYFVILLICKPLSSRPVQRTEFYYNFTATAYQKLFNYCAVCKSTEKLSLSGVPLDANPPEKKEKRNTHTHTTPDRDLTPPLINVAGLN